MTYLCLQVDAGLVYSEVAAIADCPATAYIGVPQSQYSDLPSLTAIFTIPVADDLQQMWMTGFAVPVICYLTAWAFQSVIGWFENKNGQY